MKTILVDAWNTFITEKGINKDLKTLLDSHINPKIILTNANQEECLKFGIVNMPYEVFSLEHQPNKTDKIYFEKFLEQYNLTPQDVIYFEHNIEAVNSAKSIGIQTFHFNPLASLNNLATFINENI